MNFLLRLGNLRRNNFNYTEGSWLRCAFSFSDGLAIYLVIDRVYETTQKRWDEATWSSSIKTRPPPSSSGTFCSVDWSSSLFLSRFLFLSLFSSSCYSPSHLILPLRPFLTSNFLVIKQLLVQEPRICGHLAFRIRIRTRKDKRKILRWNYSPFESFTTALLLTV